MFSDSRLRDLYERLPHDVVQVVDQGQIGYLWTDVASAIARRRRPGGQRRSDRLFRADVSQISGAIEQLRVALAGGAVLLVVLALLAARLIARGSSPRSRPPAGPPNGSSGATCRPACRSRLGTIRDVGRAVQSHGRPSATRSAVCGLRRRRTGGSWPTCRTSCGRRWRRSWPRPRSCASTSTIFRRRAAGPPRCS